MIEEVRQYCLNCGAQLYKLRSDKKYCSTRCRQTAYIRRQSGHGETVELWQASESDPKFAELTVIPSAYNSAPLTPQIEVLMNNGNRLLFYQTPSAEFVKHIVS